MVNKILITFISVHFILHTNLLKAENSQKENSLDVPQYQSKILGSSLSYFPDESQTDDQRKLNKNAFRKSFDTILLDRLLMIPEGPDGTPSDQETEPFLGLPMRYPTFQDPRAEKQTAMAVLAQGRPIVVYGPEAAKKWGNNVMGIVLQHEYCHHDLWHIRTPPQGDASIREAQADCCSAYNSIVNYKQEIPVQEVIEVHKKKGCKYDPKTPIARVREDHPCGAQRAYIITKCATEKIYQLDNSFFTQSLPIEIK